RRRVVPVEDEPQSSASEHPLDPAAVARAAKLLDVCAPVVGQLGLSAVLEHPPVVRVLSVLTLDAEVRPHDFGRRHRRKQPPVSLVGERALRVRERIRRRRLEGFDVHGFEKLDVQIFHDGRLAFSMRRDRRKAGHASGTKKDWRFSGCKSRASLTPRYERPPWCAGSSRSLTVLTGLNVSSGTSTNTVFHPAIAPFQSPGRSSDRSGRPSWDFSAMK